MRALRLLPLLAALGPLGACDRELPAAEYGERLFSDHTVSTSNFNRFSCATCHSVEAGAPAVVPGRLDAGYNLANAAGRQGFWGGYETTLLDAINTCVERFMGGRTLEPGDDAARGLYAYLDAHSPEPTPPALPFTLVRDVTPLGDLAGDAARGSDLYKKACARCHGEAHTAEGRLTTRATRVPEDTLAMFPDQGRAIVVEKVRHGKFFNIAGAMPLYSAEALSDQQLADILAYLGLPPKP
jgi:thiosulfate dehydrogenase